MLGVGSTECSPFCCFVLNTVVLALVLVTSHESTSPRCGVPSIRCVLNDHHCFIGQAFVKRYALPVRPPLLLPTLPRRSSPTNQSVLPGLQLSLFRAVSLLTLVTLLVRAYTAERRYLGVDDCSQRLVPALALALAAVVHVFAARERSGRRECRPLVLGSVGRHLDFVVMGSSISVISVRPGDLVSHRKPVGRRDRGMLPRLTSWVRRGGFFSKARARRRGAQIES